MIQRGTAKRAGQSDHPSQLEFGAASAVKDCQKEAQAMMIPYQ
jgi:hypothetical protein